MDEGVMTENTMRLTAADCAPLARDALQSVPVRTAQSTPRRVWRRLLANRGAMFSLVFIVLLLLFVLLGRFFWRVDPYEQDISRISRAPDFSPVALIVKDHSDYQPVIRPVSDNATEPLAMGEVSLMSTATTEGVAITWAPVVGSSGYRVYRHEYPPRSRVDLGVPLGEIKDAAFVSFEDVLRLEPVTYYYSVTPMVAGEPTPVYRTLKVNVRQALTLSEATDRGLTTKETEGHLTGQTVAMQPYPMGTDYLGRDMLARLIHGGETSLFIGIVAPLIAVLIGLIYGGLAGFIGGRTDEVMMRFADFVIALPFLLFMILFKVAFGLGAGESGIVPMLVAMVVLGWPQAARLIRAEVLKIREEAYVEAARIGGASPFYIVLHHVLPNVAGLLLVSLTFAIPSAIFTEAFLSFIGMGVVPPVPSWGSMCNDGLLTLMTYPHELFFPALFISLTVLAFNLFGDGLRDALDIRTQVKA